MEINRETQHAAHLYDTHRVDNSHFCFLRANNLKRRQEVRGDCNQGIFRPAAKPVHSATAEKPRKLQRTIAELLSHLEILVRLVRFYVCQPSNLL